MTEATPTIGVLGIEGSYTYGAGQYFSPESGKEGTVGFKNFDAMTDALKGGAIDKAVIPVINSIDDTLDNQLRTIARSGVYAVAEASQPIEHQLLVVEGVESYEEILTVHTKAEVISQCSNFIADKLGHARILAGTDSASCSRSVAETGDPSVAAIGSRTSAREYGLTVLNDVLGDEQVANKSHNQTRFWLLEREQRIVEGADLTAFLIDAANDPGSLYKILGAFALPWGGGTEPINLSDLKVLVTDEGDITDPWAQSRDFYIEAEASIANHSLRSAIETVQMMPDTTINVLGSFARGATMPSA